MSVSLSMVTGRKGVIDRPAVRTTVPAGTVVSTAIDTAASTIAVGSITPVDACSQGLAGIVQVAVPAPTWVILMPRRWLRGGRGTSRRR